MKKFFIGIFATSLLLASVSADAGGRRGDPVPPRLVSPVDNTVLAPGQDLEFRWSPEGDRAGFQYYDFRLYRGPQTIEAGLILHEKVSGGKTSFIVKSDVFKDGETYAWSMRMVGSKKSRPVHSVFKITKNG